MTKISKITPIILLTSVIIGIIFLIYGIIAITYMFEQVHLNELHQYDPDWDPYDPFFDLYYGMIYIKLGTIFIIITVIISFTYCIHVTSKVVEKKNYMNLEWLNHQYNELGRSLQDIANNQGVSMIIIKKWVDKLPNR